MNLQTGLLIHAAFLEGLRLSNLLNVILKMKEWICHLMMVTGMAMAMVTVTAMAAAMTMATVMATAAMIATAMATAAAMIMATEMVMVVVRRPMTAQSVASAPI